MAIRKLVLDKYSEPLNLRDDSSCFEGPSLLHENRHSNEMTIAVASEGALASVTRLINACAAFSAE